MKPILQLKACYAGARAEMKAIAILCLFILTGYNGFAQNGLNFQAGQVVNAGAGSALNITTGTWEAWVNPIALGNRRIFFKEMAPGVGLGMYELFINGSFGNVMRAAVRINGNAYNVIGTTPVPINAWTHVAVTYNGTFLDLYVNGVLESSAFAPGPMDPGTGSLGIGANVTGSPGAAFMGTMDEVRLWNVVRTQAQIIADMNHELCGNESGLVLYYNFNQGVAGGNNSNDTIAIDGAGGDNNGTLSGFALNGPTSNWVTGNNLPGCAPAGITLTWNGSTSTNWNTPTNWTPNAVPTAYDSVVLVLKPNQPAISANASVRSIRFNAANVYVTVNGGATLNVSTNLSGNSNAKFIGTGTVAVTGANAQLTNTIAANNLRVGGTFTLTNVAATRLDIVNTLEINNGTLNSNGKLFMKSTATGTANIAPIVNGSITGTVTQERYIAAGPLGYEYLATGVAGQTLASLGDDISVVFGNPASVQWYKESLPGDRTASGWTSFTNSANPMTPHKGLAAYMYARPRTIDYLGLPYQGNQNIPVTYTNGGQPTEDGFNLVANPYISDIDWDAPTGWTRTDIDPNIYILNPATNNNVSYNYITNIGFGGFNGKIANGQAFFVQAISASAVLSASENVKTSGALFYKQDDTLNTYLRMQVMGENGNGDEMLLGFAEQATDKFDRQLDAIKLANNYVDMSIAANDGSSLSQQFIGNETESAIIPILFNTNGETGKFTITMANAASVNKEIYLRDNLTGALTDVHANTSYTFEVTTANINQNQNRFDLVIGSTDIKAAMPAVKVEVFPNPARTQVNIALNGLADNASLKVYDVIGHVVYQQTGLTNSRYTINTGNWQAGVYMIEVTSDNIKTTQRLSVTD